MRIASAVAVMILVLATTSLAAADAKERQWVEGFDKVEFHHNAGGGGGGTRDFRGMARGYMTAGWWAPGQLKDNYVSWKTVEVPEKEQTTFAFIASTSVLPSELSRGPSAKLSINGKDAVTFTLGYNQDRTWKEGEYELKYVSKRVEFPYAGPHRQLTELHGNSGIYQLTVPASAVEAGKPALLKVEILPSQAWHNGWFMVKERRDVLKQSMESLQGEIEALRQDMNRVNQQAQMLATQVYRDLLGDERFEHEVIYHDGYRHLHPADLIRLKNGELLLLTREGTEHISNDGDVVMVRSKDGGKTWGKREVVSAIKDLDEREGCGIQLKDGTIVVGVFFNGLYNTDGSYMSGPDRLKKETEPGKPHLGAHIVTSKDDGRTWSEPKFIDTKDMPFSNLEGPTDAPIEMPDGSIIMGVIGYSPKGDVGNRAAVMIRSEDKGQTWKYLSTMASDPGGKLGGFMEPGIVRTKTGRIVTGLRNHGPDNAIWTTYSDDDGKTWAPVKKTDMIGHPVDLVQLSDGRLMATYGIRTQHALPAGVRACFSSDNGETWDVRTEVQIRKDFTNWDIGYPESIELPDGRVLTVYYYNLFNKYFLGGTFWKP
ncbi:MAG: sialidase family protein [Tepidisphaeraceae bacterium]